MGTQLIVDGNSLLNRAFYGMRPLTAPDGRRTEAVFGMLRMILKEVDKYSPDVIVTAFDVRAKTFRHLMYDAYKGKRKGMPDELAGQLPIVKEVLRAMGVSVLEMEGYEADDILGTVAARGEAKGVKSYVLTGDRDSLQLIGGNTVVLIAGNAETTAFDTDAFVAKYGVLPGQFVDVKALMGDASDNIPGVPGIGEKTAFKLISEYGSLDGVYDGIEDKEIAAGVKSKLIAGKDSAYMSRKLATIDRCVPLCGDSGDSESAGKRDNEKLTSLLKELGFTSLLKSLVTDTEAKSAAGADSDGSGDGADDSLTGKEKIVPVALTPSGMSGFDGELYCSINEKSILFTCAKGTFECAFDSVSEISGFFGKDARICVYDSKAAQHLLLSAGITGFDFDFDIMLAAYVLNSDDGDYSLARIAAKYGCGEARGNDDVAVYGDVMRALSARMAEEGCAELYRTTELPAAKVLARMEVVGFKVDTEGLREFSSRLLDAMQAYESEIYGYAGGEFNINSTKQLGEVLFERLGLPSFKKTKSGYSTDAAVLEKLRPYHPVIECILEYRKVAKLRSTYAEGLGKAADESGRIHTVFKQTGTATGRLSSAEPNLQNIPIRTELGHEMRRYFIPGEGYLLLDADYSQIELRILAALSGDPTMIKAFRDGTDIHAVTASQVFGVPLESVSGEMRKRAKAVNFGIVYGIGEYSLSQDIKTSVREAKEYISAYFEKYPKIKEYLNGCVAAAKADGYVSTCFGRRRYIPELTSGKAVLRSFGERVAMNSPIQGSAADIMKKAMINVTAALDSATLDARIILQVHDELVVEASVDCAEKAGEILRREMEKAFISDVPLVAEVTIGKTWYENK